MQLRNADVILCAVEPQRERLEAALDALGRRPPPPAGRGRRVRPAGGPAAVVRAADAERFPQIGAGRHRRALVGQRVALVRRSDGAPGVRPRAATAAGVRLVFTAGKHPRRDWPVLDASEQARDLAAEMGLLGESVFFLDDWVPQEERHHYLLEADVGLTLHRDTAETAVAARGRYMDYAWAGLPACSAPAMSSPTVSPRPASPRRSPRATSTAPSPRSGASSTTPGERERRRAASRPLADEFRWSATVQPLLRALDAGGRERPRAARRVALGRDLGEYYARKALLAATPGRPEPGRGAGSSRGSRAARRPGRVMPRARRAVELRGARRAAPRRWTRPRSAEPAVSDAPPRQSSRTARPRHGRRLRPGASVASGRACILRHVPAASPRPRSRAPSPLPGAGGATGEPSIATGTSERAARDSSAAGSRRVREHRGMDPVRELAQVGEPGLQVARHPVTSSRSSALPDCAARRRASCSISAAETKRCCAPSCRSRSSRRRAASAASTMRVRDARTSRACAASASCRRSRSSAARRSVTSKIMPSRHAGRSRRRPSSRARGPSAPGRRPARSGTRS